MLYRENLTQATKRISREYGLQFGSVYLVGVYPVRFPSRSDVSIDIAALNVRGEPRVDGFEFSKFSWFHKLPVHVGANYRHMMLD